MKSDNVLQIIFSMIIVFVFLATPCFVMLEKHIKNEHKEKMAELELLKSGIVIGNDN